MLKNVEILGHDTIRTVIDAVVKLRELRKELIANVNDPIPEEDDTQDDDGSDTEGSCCDGEDENVDKTNKRWYKVHGCHIHLLQLCPCRSAAACTCEADSRVPDTIFYRREPGYEAEVIQGCASMFAYRFLPRRKYIVEIRQYACETCPGCNATRDDDRRYHGCVNLNTVRATSYKGRGHRQLLGTGRCKSTGWVEHTIVPIRTTALTGTRATDGLTRVDHRARLEYVGNLCPGDNVFTANTDDGISGEFKPRHFWLAQLLPPPNKDSPVVWKTSQPLPPDVAAGSYCCKIQWFHRTSRDGRVFKLASAQFISLSCIVPANYKIVLTKNGNRYKLDEEIQKKILTTLNGLVVDD